ncbi:putative restriction modification system DNA specificity domain protein [Candidatus Nitrososphaera gargensis Ga9.2]|uniref:Putative restriction modification system DNA specificity domain protein n=1 Tax=Nitrososphaera gargensis (strain Ga9.2) TaxID=1237085 RepID=K0IKL5_NITGG|nr:restriction endonuclease subunit S [Candidatus Nitrososphaera gargensis]AFU59833.1 putative restriction modification system DNA specificity domain protein [Candidatus Nitrososphaera gargensis Ga9.2]
MMKEKTKTKFKETEIGKIPEEWEVASVSDLADIYIGGTPKTEVGEYWNGEIKWASAKDVSNCRSRYICNTERTITNTGIENSNAKIFPKDTLVITSRGTVGKLALLGEPMSFNQTCYGLVAKKQTIPLFLYYKLKDSVDKIQSASYGTIFDTITTKTFNELKLGIPPLHEQHSIVRILSDLDSKIELNQQMNKTLEEMGRAIFKHWFIDFEFPNEEGKPYKSSGGEMINSDIGTIPKGWRISSIGHEIEVGGGSTPSTSESSYWDGGDINWATPKDMSSLTSPILVDTQRKITTKGLDAIGSRKYPRGTLLMSSRAPIGYLAISDIATAVNQGIIAMVCTQSLSSYFMLNWCKFNMEKIENRANGTTFREISKSNFRTMGILVPPKSLLSRFDGYARMIYSHMSTNIRHSYTLQNIRDSLLPKLMSGKIRVPVEAQ